MIHTIFKMLEENKNKANQPGLPWWSSGKESGYQYRGHRFNPWSENIPRKIGNCTLALQLLSPCSKPEICNKKSHLNEKSSHCN